MGDIVRVLRLVEYVGERSRVEEQIGKSVHGSRPGIVGVVITAQTVGEFPEVLDSTSALATALAQVDALQRAYEADTTSLKKKLESASGTLGEPARYIRDEKDDHE